MTEAALEDVYAGVQKLIHNTVWKFHNVYGTDIDELQSVSNLLFMNAVESYDPKKVKFSTWLSTKLWFGFLSLLRSDMCQNKTKTDLFTDGDLQEFTHQNHFLLYLKDTLSMEALDFVNLILETPKELRTTTLRRGGKQKNLGRVVKEHLYKIGWSTRHIRETIKEIKEVLREY